MLLVSRTPLYWRWRVLLLACRTLVKVCALCHALFQFCCFFMLLCRLVLPNKQVVILVVLIICHSFKPYGQNLIELVWLICCAWTLLKSQFIVVCKWSFILQYVLFVSSASNWLSWLNYFFPIQQWTYYFYYYMFGLSTK